MISPRILKRAFVNAVRCRHIAAPLDVMKGFLCGRSIPVRWKNLQLTARTEDWCAVREIFIEHEYAIALDVLKTVENPVVVDLGANIGGFSAYILAARADAKLVSMEASKATFTLLQQNATRNSGYQWRPYHYAAWRENGMIEFAKAEHSTGSYVADLKRNSGLAVEQTPTIDFPSVLEKTGAPIVHLMKIDIEGAEESFLSSAGDRINNVEALLIEFHPNVIDADALMEKIRRTHPVFETVGNRKSSKPLMLFRKQ